jgi:hypothetical protein
MMLLPAPPLTIPTISLTVQSAWLCPTTARSTTEKKDPKQLTHLASQSSESFDSTFTVQKNTIDPRTTSRATALTIASSYETTPFARFVDATLRINFGFPATDRLDFFLRCVRGAQQ